MNTLAYALPEIIKEVERMKKQIETQVMTDINNGSLLPELAQQRWIEWAAAHRLQQRVSGKVKMEGEK
jgi:hypothetical protein